MRSHATAAGVTRQPLQPSDKPPESLRGSDYAQLSRQIRQAGLMERRPAWYAWRIAVTVALLAVGWAAFVIVGNSWWQLMVAPLLAVWFTHVCFVGTHSHPQHIPPSRTAHHHQR